MHQRSLAVAAVLVVWITILTIFNQPALSAGLVSKVCGPGFDQPAAFCGAPIVSVQSIQASPVGHVALRAGGIMTPGLEIHIDLATGLATKKTMPRGTLMPGEKPNWQETQKQLSASELQQLRDTISRTLVEGLRSKACYEEDKHAAETGTSLQRWPSIDSITVLDVLWQGQVGRSPEQGCESPAYNTIWRAAYSAASP